MIGEYSIGTLRRCTCPKLLFHLICVVVGPSGIHENEIIKADRITMQGERVEEILIM